MKYNYKKLFDTNLGIQGQCQAQGKSGKWHNARGVQYNGGFFLQLQRAWDVFWGKADALYWMIDLDK